MRTTAGFTKEEATRYRGHLSLCEIDIAGQRAIADGKVLIIGAGGLGSPVALYLAAAGTGTIGLMDADTVSLSNLQRQVIHTTADIGRLKVDSAAEKMNAIDPGVKIVKMPLALDDGNAADIIGGYDIVVDCTDNLTTRLLINDTCVRLGKTMVYGAVSRFSGQVFSHVAGSACYRCIFGLPEAGDAAEPPCAVSGVMNSVVGVIGSIQATEVVKLLVGTGTSLVDRLLTFDAISMTFNTFSVSPSEDCMCRSVKHF